MFKKFKKVRVVWTGEVRKNYEKVYHDESEDSEKRPS